MCAFIKYLFIKQRELLFINNVAMKKAKQLSDIHIYELNKIVELIRAKLEPVAILLYGYYAGMEDIAITKGYKFFVIYKDKKVDAGLLHRIVEREFPVAMRMEKSTFFISASQSFYNSEVRKNYFCNRLKKEGVFLYIKPGETLVQKNGFAVSTALRKVQRDIKLNLNLGNNFLELAQQYFLKGDTGLSSFLISQSLTQYFVLVIRVYFGLEIYTKASLCSMFNYVRQCDESLVNLWDLDFEEVKQELNIIENYKTEPLNQVDFIIPQKTVRKNLRRIESLGKIIARVCQKRVDLLNQIKDDVDPKKKIKNNILP